MEITAGGYGRRRWVCVCPRMCGRARLILY
jgi:hypothetical protein